MSYVNSEQFTIIRLLIRPFPEKMNTKSLLSVFVIVLVIVIIQKNDEKNTFSLLFFVRKIANLYRKCKNQKTKNMALF